MAYHTHALLCFFSFNNVFYSYSQMENKKMNNTFIFLMYHNLINCSPLLRLIWIVCHLLLLKLMLYRLTFVLVSFYLCKCVCRIISKSKSYLGDRNNLFVIFINISKLFSVRTIPTYLSTNSLWEFHFIVFTGQLLQTWISGGLIGENDFSV